MRSKQHTSLGLTTLEPREVPAVNTWIGTSDDFHNPAYWTDGVPTSDDIIVFSGPVLSPVSPPPVGPPGASPLPPTSPPPPSSHQSVTFPDTLEANFEPVYAGIRYLNGYGGTVTFPADLEFGEWTQNSGTTAQAADTVISVTGTFGWVGGTINANSNAATMNLVGVVNGQIGEDSTSITTGSNFLLSSNIAGIGSSVRQAGVLDFNNAHLIEIEPGSVFEQRKINLQQPNAPKAKGDIEVKGQFVTEGGEVKSVLVLGTVNNGPSAGLTVKAGGLTVTGKVPTTNWGVLASGVGPALVIIPNGETLTAVHGVKISNNGTLVTQSTSSQQIAQVATIDGLLRVNGTNAKVILGEATNTESTCYSELLVTENAELWNGEFKPKLSSQTSASFDDIKTNKKLDTGPAFSVTPDHGANQPYAAAAWPVLQSVLGFKDHLNPTNGKPLVYTMDRSAFEELPDGQIVELYWVVKPKP